MEASCRITIDGFTFYRNPQAKDRAHKVYFFADKATREACGFGSLHRYVWGKAHGPIPAGHVIHHVDGDPLNNGPENLECLTRKQHASEHPMAGNPKVLANLANIRPLATAWHKSEDGRRWHREHGGKAYSKTEPQMAICIWCGAECVRREDEKRFCSRKCIELYNWKMGTYHESVACTVCGKEYRRRKYSKKPSQSCSPKCAAVVRRRNRPSLQPDGC